MNVSETGRKMGRAGDHSAGARDGESLYGAMGAGHVFLCRAEGVRGRGSTTARESTKSDSCLPSRCRTISRPRASFLDGKEEGDFAVTPPLEGNHGPVHVAYTYHFAYEDGTPDYPAGTTCYVWELQSEELQEETLRELAKGYFNKIRFCVFPKHYIYNFHDADFLSLRRDALRYQ